MMDPRGFEREPRTSKQKFCRRGDKDFACRRCTCDACGFVDSNASNVGAHQLDLARMNSGSDGDAEVAD